MTMQCKHAGSCLGALALALILTTAGCNQAPEEAPAEALGGRVNVNVAALEFPGIDEAIYRLTVRNLAGEMVWQKTISSTQYGNGAGEASYVGPCDSDSSPNSIALELESLSARGNVLTPGDDYANPAPLGSPIVRNADCEADADVRVDFDVTVARAAQQGFFDISVDFNNLFCSAKLDCERIVNGQPQPIELLYNPHTNLRDRTAVLGFACTAGPDQDTYLHMDPVAIECNGTAAQTFYVDSQDGPGNLNPPFPGPPNDSDLIFQAATYRGEEQLGSTNKFYWNVAIGLNEDAFADLQPCVLTGRATASNGPLTNGTTTEGMRWPYIDWEVPLVSGVGDYVCGAHELGGGTEVEVTYSEGAISFGASIARSAPETVAINGCDINEVCGDCTSSCLLGSGTGLDEVTGGGSGGDPPSTLAEELETKVNTDDIVGLVASPTGGLTLADQNYDLPFMWVANHGEDTVSKIDTREMKEVGRYRVCDGPSRTAVDLDGNAFVSCRLDGGVVKLGVIPPNCKESNGTPGIQTSSDLDGNGVIQGAEILAAGTDECVLWTKTPAAPVSCATVCGRAAGVDVNNDLWIGNWSNQTIYRLDGETGETLDSWPSPIKSYGLAIAQDGTIWITSREPNGALAKLDPQTGVGTIYYGSSGNYSGTASTDAYGLAIDPWGNIWQAQYATQGIRRFDPTTNTFSGPYGQGIGGTRGVAIKSIYDDNGDLQGAEVYSGHSDGVCHQSVSYVKLDASGAVLRHGTLSIPGSNGPIGSAIDVDGNIWAISNCEDRAVRYLVEYDENNGWAPTVTIHDADLDTAGIQHTATGDAPYTYSDMTGQALRNIAGVDGYYRHRWTGWSTGSTWWKALTLDATLPGDPGVTWLEVRLRSGDDPTALDSATWTDPPIIVDSTTEMPVDLSDGGARRIAKYFDMEIRFRTSDPGGQVPEVNGIGLVVYHLD